jgi:tetratricopeptide (TPR) repeat protein
LEIEEKLPILKKYLANVFRTPTPELLQKTELLAQTITLAHPYDLEGWVSLAKLYALQDNFQEAKKYYEKCIELDPSQSSIWEDYFFIISKLNDYTIILENVQLLEEYFPTNAKIQYGLSLILLENKQYNSAIKAAKQALAFTFENSFVAELNLLLGDLYFETKEKEEAVKYWKTAQRRGINTPELQKKIEENQ